jgi:hypothetical protein
MSVTNSLIVQCIRNHSHAIGKSVYVIPASLSQFTTVMIRISVKTFLMVVPYTHITIPFLFNPDLLYYFHSSYSDYL